MNVHAIILENKFVLLNLENYKKHIVTLISQQKSLYQVDPSSVNY